MSTRKPDIGYIPTPPEVLEAILNLAQITPDDIVYDLGSGDGRILISAAECGARGVGIDIDPKRLEEAKINAEKAGVSQQLEFRCQDLFNSNFSEATIIFIYLLPHLNLKLKPILFSQLKPGTKIISLDFNMGDWQPQKTQTIPTPEEESTLYYWVI